ncbi:hypothetical protein GCM10010492_57830 [Saccharothrix mutabilis subsp. mutabilis]|uniref:Lipoprotein n=2 Tax=Saccharothrix mutabilis TaxID=33921 RepID=A0ABN0UGX6_9PSEU
MARAGPPRNRGGMTTNSRRLLGALLVVAVVTAGCAAGPNDVSTVDGVPPAGFWPGVWHGLIHPITFIVSLFNHNVNIYEVHNNGNWYNFGFVLGIAVLHTFTSGNAARRGRRRRGGSPA